MSLEELAESYKIGTKAVSAREWVVVEEMITVIKNDYKRLKASKAPLIELDKASVYLEGLKALYKVGLYLENFPNREKY